MSALHSLKKSDKSPVKIFTCALWPSLRPDRAFCVRVRRSSRVKKLFLKMFWPTMATITRSAKQRVRCIMSICPLVMGSKLPGQMAVNGVTHSVVHVVSKRMNVSLVVVYFLSLYVCSPGRSF